MEELKASFLRAYSNVPLSLRDNTLVLVAGIQPEADIDTPISWNVAYLEIIGNTDKAEKILRALREIDII